MSFDWNVMIWKTNHENLSTLYPLNYLGEHDLLDYYLDNVTVDIQNPYLTLTLHLSGRYEYHLLNSFCPSALMFVISYSTLFFPINDFNERIMGSLTSLLVLAGLFAQASGSYIKTPYFKLIDVWYAVLILLCFVVVTTNSLVNSFRPKNGSGKKNRRAKVCNKIAKIVVMVIFVSLLVVFFLFGVEVL